MRNSEDVKILNTIIIPFVNDIIINKPLTNNGKFSYIENSWIKLENLIEKYDFSENTKKSLLSKYRKKIDDGVQKN